jgi:hypothetical protein
LGIERDNGAERALFGRSFTNDGPHAPRGTSRSALPALRETNPLIVDASIALSAPDPNEELRMAVRDAWDGDG